MEFQPTHYTPTLTYLHDHTFSHIFPDYDCILHVNPYIEHRGLAMVFNPTLSPSIHNSELAREKRWQNSSKFSKERRE